MRCAQPLGVDAAVEHRIQALTRWNDAKARTSDEVLAIMDRAIARTILGMASAPAPRVPVAELSVLSR